MDADVAVLTAFATPFMAMLAMLWHQQRAILKQLGENGERLARIEGCLGIGMPLQTHKVTSNHPALLDSAVWRRFDEIVELESPDESARSEILTLKLRSVRHDFDVADASKQMERFSVAEVEAVALDAIRLMVRRLDKAVNSEHVAYAIDLGEARRQTVRRSLG